jgi:SepF-like predicted cell division protein (DUF552 family)
MESGLDGFLEQTVNGKVTRVQKHTLLVTSDEIVCFFTCHF